MYMRPTINNSSQSSLILNSNYRRDLTPYSHPQPSQYNESRLFLQDWLLTPERYVHPLIVEVQLRAHEKFQLQQHTENNIERRKQRTGKWNSMCCHAAMNLNWNLFFFLRSGELRDCFPRFHAPSAINSVWNRRQSNW